MVTITEWTSFFLSCHFAIIIFIPMKIIFSFNSDYRRVVHRNPELIERFIVLNCPHAKYEIVPGVIVLCFFKTLINKALKFQNSFYNPSVLLTSCC